MDPDPKHPLEYDRTINPSVTRAQFRLLLLLMLIQVVMTAQSSYAPGVREWVKSAWAAHQAARAEAARRTQVEAIERQCMTFAQPAGKVAWEEDPQRASALRGAGADYRLVTSWQRYSGPATALIPPGAALNVPRAFIEIMPVAEPSADTGLVFLHGRRSGRGTERLVVVWAAGRVDVPEALLQSTPQVGSPVDASLSKVHGLVAVALDVGASQGSPTPSASEKSELWLRSFDEPIQMPVHWLASASPDAPTTMRIDYREQFRVYSGVADPADASHVTISYAIDNVPGTIDAYLEDNGTIRLTPRKGIVSGLRWYPNAR